MIFAVNLDIFFAIDVSKRLIVQPLHENSKFIWVGVLQLILLSPTFLELAIESFVKHLIHSGSVFSKC